MRRRALLAAFPALAAASPAAGQQDKPVIAVLALGAFMVAGFAKVRARLRDLGLVDGRDYRIESRDAGGDAARLPALAVELLAYRPAVVVLGGHVAAEAVQGLSRTVPIVVNGLNDPVAAGFVASLERPGGNITGVANMSAASEARLVEIVREMLPGARRITVVTNPKNLSLQPVLEAFRRRTAPLGITVDALKVAHPYDLDAAFAAMVRDRPDALMIMQDGTLQLLSGDIIARALARRVPCFGTLYFQFVEQGALFTHAKDTLEAAQSVALLLSRILRGANPADLPVEQPMRFHLRINLGTAKTLRLTVPQSILAQADEVIE
jgi:putative ABC transport system substrate-binding protein